MSNPRVVQQTVKAKRVARIPNLLLEIPYSITENYSFIKKDSRAKVSIEEHANTFVVMYEFEKVESNADEEKH